MNSARELLGRIFNSQKKQEEEACGIEIIIDPVVDLVEEPSKPKLETTLGCPKYSAELSRRMNCSCNPTRVMELDQLRHMPHPEDAGKVWIYNISELEYTLSNGLIPKLKIRGCKPEERYVVATSLPEVFREPVHNVDTDTVEFRHRDGRRVAQDLINPQNLGFNQDFDIADTSTLATGSNYNQRGVFWSRHNPPLKSELEAAHARLKKYYESVVEIANIERISAAAKRLNVPTSLVKAADDYLEWLQAVN